MSGRADVVGTARALAEELHAGQSDKGGAPYVEHVARVANRVADGGHGPEHVAAAWLHDVVEDCGVGAEELRAAGMPEVVVDAVLALTRRADEPYLDAVRRAAAHPVARVVKLADDADNSDPVRRALLDPATRERLDRKDQQAREVLLGGG